MTKDTQPLLDGDRTDNEWHEFCRPFVYLNGSHEMPNYAGICRAVLALSQGKQAEVAEPVAPRAEPAPKSFLQRWTEVINETNPREADSAQPVGADTLTDAPSGQQAEMLARYIEHYDVKPSIECVRLTRDEAQSILDALASPPRAIPAEQAAPTEPKECDLPPAGWHCTRGKGHEGPCAAVLMEGVSKEWCKAHPGGAAYIINTLAKRIDDAAHPHEAADRSAEARDAARYRWLREQDWFDGPLCVLRDPKRVLTRGVGLGADCPSRDRLDAAIDALAAQPVAGHRGDSNA